MVMGRARREEAAHIHEVFEVQGHFHGGFQSDFILLELLPALGDLHFEA